MKLRWRLALASAMTAAISVIVVIVAAYLITCRRVESALGHYEAYPDRPPPGVLASLGDVDDLGWPFLAVAFGGLLLSGALGWLAAHTALRPVGILKDAAERVASTRDLTTRIEVAKDDELGSLARSFNTMLDALERSARAQKRLVADASHELRTPLTALRTNVELLIRGGPDQEDHDEISRAAMAGMEELTVLISDVVELARDEEPAALVEDVRLDEIVTREVSRASAHWPSMSYQVSVEPAVVRGVSDRLSRAVANLLDNAGKYGPPGGAVEVSQTGGVVTVRDHGKGIAAEDLPHVFDRFYRAPGARAMPGSGLGLAIVRQVVDSHGGSVAASAAPGGGTLVRLDLPLHERQADLDEALR
ncbi:HAMP domain-containing histidine kinase [Microtetraspora sp. AC03309]|uniref:sensor histidine kinase n=1 Tax=Microtetraspora sp. AC03309 TaxID=2779376 RepID=UPI000773FD35|nr:HAMP domain-containing sensor histidine kinase [Microtetraspora sp. AC03309]MCC5576817.1 HAMP domain-containing histidine kinase [Microtetraspora sp. AC03309]